jgi:hypothetical protein
MTLLVNDTMAFRTQRRIIANGQASQSNPPALLSKLPDH